MPGKVLRHLLRRACAGALRRPARRRRRSAGCGAGGAPASRATYRANRGAHAPPRPLQPRAAARADARGCTSTTSAPTASSCCCARARDLALAEPGIRALRRARRRARSCSTPPAAAQIEPGSTPRRRCTPASTRRTTRSATAASSRTCCARRRSARGVRLPLRHRRSSGSSPARGRRCVVAARRAIRATRRVRSRADRRLVGDRAGRRDRRRAELRRGRRLRGARLARAAAAARRAPAAAAGVRLLGHRAAAPRRAHLHLEPRAALMDERYKVAISRLGNRVRVAGSAEIGGPPERAERRARWPRSYKVLDDWFPGVARREPGAALERRAADAARRPAGARARAAPKASGSTSATAAAAGRWPAARRALVADAIAGRHDADRHRRPRHRAAAALSGQSSAMATCSHVDRRPAAAAVRRRRDARGSRQAALAALPPHTLMARAGDAVARLALALAPHARTRPGLRRPGQQRRRRPRSRDCACARCGKAGRGACCSATPPRLPADARAGARARAARPACRSRLDAAARRDDAPDLVIDALLGIGALARRPTARSPRRSPRIDGAARGVRCSRSTCRPASTPTRGQPLGDACVVADAHAGADRRPSPGLFTGVGPRPRRHGLVRRASASTPTAHAPDAWLVGAAAIARRARRAATPSTRAASATSPSSAAPPAWPARRCSPRAPRMPPAPGASSSTCSTPARRRSRSIPRGPS